MCVIQILLLTCHFYTNTLLLLNVLAVFTLEQSMWAVSPSDVCCLGGLWSFCWRPPGHEWARWTEGAGRSLSRGWERALCREEAEYPLQRESPLTTVWRSVVECPPLPTPSVLFLCNKEDRETGSDWAALDLPPCLRGGRRVPLSL